MDKYIKKRNKTKRQLQGEETKKKIFAIATDLIHSKGYDNVTVDEICQKAGISKGGYYVHYNSKSDIVRDIYRMRSTDNIIEHLEEYIKDNPESTPIDRIKAYITVSMDFVLLIGDELTLRSFIIEFSEALTQQSTLLESRNEIKLLEDIIDAGLSQGYLKQDWDKKIIVNYVLNFVAGAMMLHCLVPQNFDTKSLIEYEADILIRGLSNK